MRFAFCTCVQIGLSCMEAIYRIGGKLDLIISLPDEKAKSKSGRIYVDHFATLHKIPVVKSPYINDEHIIEALSEHKIDWLFIVGWSQIASKQVIEKPTFGAIGAHPTLLPEGRGRAAIPWSIIKGLNKTGVTFFKMDEGVDTGSILGQEEVFLEINETATTLYKKINQAHETLVQKLYTNLLKGDIIGVEQDESKATYWPGRKPEDGELKKEMTIQEVDRLVRATTHPYPGAFINIGNKKVIIWSGIIGETLNSGMQFEFKDGIYSVLEFMVIEE